MKVKSARLLMPFQKLLALFSLLLVSLFFSLLLGACGDTPTPAKTAAPSANAGANTVSVTPASLPADPNLIRIYSSMPLAGVGKSTVQASVNAFQMALDDFTNGTGKIGNFTIEYISLNSGVEATGRFDDDLEKAHAIKIAADPNTMAVVGPTNSGAAKISLPILNQVGIPMVSPDTTYPGLTRVASGTTRANEPEMYYPTKIRSYFRLSTPDDLQSPAAIEFLKTLNVKKIFVIDDSQVYGKGLADLIIITCKKEGLDCSKRTSITNQEPDYEALVSGIKANNPDAIFYAGSWQLSTPKLLKAIRAGGLTVPIVGGDGLNVETAATELGEASKNIYAINTGIPEEKLPTKGQEVLKRYKAKYGAYEYPRTLLGYESMYVILTGIKNAGVKDRKAILQAIASTRDFDGTLGKWSFDQNGDISLTDFTILHIVDKKWTVFTTVTPKFTS